MKKLLSVFAVFMVIFVLGACGETTSEDKKINSVESSSSENKTNNNDANEDVEASEVNNEDNNVVDEGELEEVGEVIADDDYIKATLENVERIKDDIFGDSHRINIKLENKTSNKLVVQSDDVSIDGTMVDDMVVFSQDVAGEKNANGKLEIMSFDEDLPEMNENIEFKLIVIDDESFDRVAEHDVKIDF